MRSQICPRSSKVNGPEATGSAAGVRSVAPPSRNCAGRAQGRVLKRLNLARRNFSNPYLVSSFFDCIVHLAGWWDPSPIYDPTQYLLQNLQLPRRLFLDLNQSFGQINPKCVGPSGIGHACRHENFHRHRPTPAHAGVGRKFREFPPAPCFSRALALKVPKSVL